MTKGMRSYSTQLLISMSTTNLTSIVLLPDTDHKKMLSKVHTAHMYIFKHIQSNLYYTYVVHALHYYIKFAYSSYMYVVHSFMFSQCTN